MKKTHLGISVGLMGAIMCFVCLFGGYIPALLIAGFVLATEDDEWLKKTCVKALALMISFSVMITVLNLLPDLLAWLDTIVAVFGGNFQYGIVNNIIGVFTGLLSLARTCIFLILGAQALNNGTLAIPGLDKMIDKHFN